MGKKHSGSEELPAHTELHGTASDLWAHDALETELHRIERDVWPQSARDTDSLISREGSDVCRI